MQSIFEGAERTLAAVAGLALFALNDVRMFHMLPRDPGNGRTHAIALQLFGAPEQVYASVLDLTLRWGLIGLTLGLCAWAVAETIPPAKRRAS